MQKSAAVKVHKSVIFGCGILSYHQQTHESKALEKPSYYSSALDLWD